MGFQACRSFLRRKTMQSKKSLTEAALREALQRGELCFPPLEVAAFQGESRHVANGRSYSLGDLLTLRWRARSYDFGVQFRRLSTPKAIDAAIQQAQRMCGAAGILPLVVAPYLSPERLAAL